MPAKTIYKKQEGISSRKLGNDLMLYDQKNDKVHVLNETGAIIWDLLDGKKDFLDIEKYFIRQFPDAKKEEISKDINEIIGKLLSEKLIVLSP